eukprot:scaffold1085_cov407-Prasinococcus_capsulatus_cf.AAC.86
MRPGANGPEPRGSPGWSAEAPRLGQRRMWLAEGAWRWPLMHRPPAAAASPATCRACAKLVPRRRRHRSWRAGCARRGASQSGQLGADSPSDGRGGAWPGL